MDWNDGTGIALTIKRSLLCLTTGFGESKYQWARCPTPCPYDWRDGCDKTATWRVGCGPDVRSYCDSHEGPPCGGVFLGDFVITPDTTREELAGVVSGGSYQRIPGATRRAAEDLAPLGQVGWGLDAGES